MTGPKRFVLHHMTHKFYSAIKRIVEFWAELLSSAKIINSFCSSSIVRPFHLSWLEKTGPDGLVIVGKSWWVRSMTHVVSRNIMNMCDRILIGCTGVCCRTAESSSLWCVYWFAAVSCSPAERGRGCPKFTASSVGLVASICLQRSGEFPVFFLRTKFLVVNCELVGKKNWTYVWVSLVLSLSEKWYFIDPLKTSACL